MQKPAAGWYPTTGGKAAMTGTATARDSTPPKLGREGVYFHQPSRQYVSRLGFELNREGRRVRAFQYLGSDPEQATVRHVAVVAEWKWTKAEWPRIRAVIRHGLPDAIRDGAEIDLPVWTKDEWWKAAKQAGHQGIVDSLTRGVKLVGERLEQGKDFMRFVAESEHRHLDRLPPESRAVVLQAVAPAAHEVLGIAPDAERLTLEQGRQRYLDDAKSRIGLPEDGIKPGTYQNTERMLRLALDLRIKDSAGVEKYALDPKAMLHEVTRDDLVAFKRGWLAKVTAGDVSKRTAANYCKAVQYFLAWVYKRDRIVSRRVADLDDVFRFTDVNPVNIADYAQVKGTIRAILADAPERVKLYVHLALNCGFYQVDIGRLRLAEVQRKGKDVCIARRRDKTSHQNSFESCHWLWPETRALLDTHLAPEDPAKNPEGLALLNEDGRPLYVGSADKAKIDNVTCSYWRVVQAFNEAREAKGQAPVSLPFKQFRKIGATAMNGIGGEQVQKCYRAASFEGADRFYVLGDFSKLTAALKKWRLRLKADGII